MEMAWDKIKHAPGALCEIEVFRVYKELGDVTIELTEYLKGLGYKSEAHHPFGGKLLYGPHVVAANLGIMGRNGLIITPEFGPRQRWSIITTDADIPKTKERDFSDLINFCEKCGACVRECKGGAVYKNPIEKENGVITHIDRSKCIQSILNNNYCSYCLRICMPSRSS
jgi:epoxyqueuosine reductase QueG